MIVAKLTRRALLEAVGVAGGLVLGLFETEAEAHAAPNASTPNAIPPNALAPNVYVQVATDGLVTIVCHRSEMGQGIRSSLPVLVADELGADMARVKIVQADGDPKYGNQNTDGSRSVRDFFETMRVAGATARTMLVAAAAQRWNVSPAACEARDHAVVHPKTKRSLGFGELAAAAAALPLPKPGAVTLRPWKELPRVGKPMPLLDGPALVTGKAAFGADVRRPGMLVAVVARPPVVGGKTKRYDEAAALKVPGVRRVVPLPALELPARFAPLGGVAVLADHTWAALRGREALAIEWEAGPNASYDSEAYRAELLAAVRAPGQTMRNVGDVDGAFARATRVVEAEYYVPHLAHAAMEPLCALAEVQGGACEVWAPTQNPQGARDEVAEALGLPKEKVTIHVTFLGGGFGRKSKPDYVVEAALLAKAAGRPVRVQWTREDDTRHDYYHTVSAQRLKASLGDGGKVTAWLHRTAFPSISTTFSPKAERGGAGELQQGVLDWPLAIPNVRAEVGAAKAHVRIGWLRSVANIYHAFAIGSFLDEIAAARGADPRVVLLEIIGPPRKLTPEETGVKEQPNYGAPLDKHPIDTGRLRGVVERVTERAGWASRKGRALGLAAHRSFLTYVATVVEVERGPGGVRVKDVWVSADAGTVVNPDRVRSQLEGAVVFGMSLALYGEITAKAGAVVQSNFRDYPLVRLPEVPARIHVDLVESEAPPGGVGEPGVPPVAPALANAVFALTGRRIRELPLRKAGVLAPA